MCEVFALLERLAATDLTVTLWGENGTGRSRLAREIHRASPRAANAFVKFDCGAVAPNMLEAALFGQESLPGSAEPVLGPFERAETGTLLLEELTAVPPELHLRLLRAIEHGSLRRSGGTVDRVVDVRVVTATSRDLRSLVAERAFTEELYFCLSAAIVAVPPLRARPEDLTLLVPQLLQTLDHGDVAIAADALDFLRSQGWPGNLRQLKHALACALSFVEEGTLEKRHLKLALPEPDDSELDRLPLGGRTLADIERAAILQTLRLSGGMKGRAARSLGIAVSTLYDKLKKYGL